MAPIVADDVRAVLEGALGDGRLAHVPADQPLLASGLISSLELVSVVAALEDHYELVIPPAQATNENLATLSRIASLLGGTASAHQALAASARRGGPLYRSFRRFLRRPLRATLLTLAALLLLDRGVEWAVQHPLRASYQEFSEHGARLYRGLGGYSHDDFRFAVQEHELSAPAKRPRVLFFGDSGTIGSFLQAEQALPAQAEARLRELGHDVDVLNLAFYGRLLVKDVMLLELAWSQPEVRAVVFTVGDDYVSRHLSDLWLQRYRHISVNWPILKDFVARVPAAERAPFLEQLEGLQEADQPWGWLRRFAFEHSALAHRAPFLNDALTARLLPKQLYSLRRRAEDSGDRRYALEPGGDRLLRDGIPAQDVDLRQLQILATVVRLLTQRGVRVLLYVEPAGPREWRQPLGSKVEANPLLQELADATGAVLVDQKWALGAPDFIDDFAHYSASGSAVLGKALGEAIQRALEAP